MSFTLKHKHTFTTNSNLLLRTYTHITGSMNTLTVTTVTVFYRRIYQGGGKFYRNPFVKKIESLANPNILIRPQRQNFVFPTRESIHGRLPSIHEQKSYSDSWFGARWGWNCSRLMHCHSRHRWDGWLLYFTETNNTTNLHLITLY